MPYFKNTAVNIMNTLHATEFFTLRWLHLCYVNFTLLKTYCITIKCFYHFIFQLIFFSHPFRPEI